MLRPLFYPEVGLPLSGEHTAMVEKTLAHWHVTLDPQSHFGQFPTSDLSWLVGGAPLSSPWRFLNVPPWSSQEDCEEALDAKSVLTAVVEKKCFLSVVRCRFQSRTEFWNFPLCDADPLWRHQCVQRWVQFEHELIASQWTEVVHSTWEWMTLHSSGIKYSSHPSSSSWTTKQERRMPYIHCTIEMLCQFLEVQSSRTSPTCSCWGLYIYSKHQ